MPPAEYGAEPRRKKGVSKIKKKYTLITRCRVPRPFLGRPIYFQTVDGRFSDSSGVLIKYFDHV